MALPCTVGAYSAAASKTSHGEDTLAGTSKSLVLGRCWGTWEPGVDKADCQLQGGWKQAEVGKNVEPETCGAISLYSVLYRVLIEMGT